MTCTRVLHAIGGYPPPGVMPDLAACLTLTQRQPIHQLLSTSTLKPAKRHCQSTATLPRTHSPHHFPSSLHPCSLSPPVPSGPRSCFRRDSGSNVNKKRVVFADAKGLALTAVRLFIPEPTSTTPTLLMKPSPAKLQGQQITFNSLQRYKLRLAFPQPILDFKAFLARLREMHVQLESCSISDRTLSGKVCVCNISIEKAVHIRVTFDSWRSHRDIPCTFLQQQRSGGSDIGVYAFELGLPQNIDPKERIEFCVSFRPGPGAAPHWDDNRGQNYRVCVEKDVANTNQSDASRFYPVLPSKLRPPSWPSHMSCSLQNCADQQHLQMGLSNRVRAEWKTLCATK